MKYALLFMGLALGLVLFAQVDPGKNNVIDFQALQKEFADPPVKYRMLQMTHTTKLDGTLDSLKKYGYGGVVSNVAFTQNYLEDEQEWQAFLDYMRKCRQLGLDFWLYDEKGYPSGKAGGLTLRDHPEYETIGIICSRTEGHGSLMHTLPAGIRIHPEPLYICAAPVHEGLYDFSAALDLTPTWKAGEPVRFTAPDGREWGILSFQVKRMFEGTHIETNISDANPYINIIDRDAVARFISVTHEAYREKAPAEMKDYIHAVFTDEPSLMTSYLKEGESLLPAVPWSRSFRETFRQRYGYDIVSSLPYLFEDGGPATLYRRLDFWSLVASLIEENYYGQLQQWCRANGPAASGHALLEESLYWDMVYEGNLYRNLRRMDLPGMDMLTSDAMALAHSTQIPVPKFISSVAHMTGKWETISETSAHYQRSSNLPVTFNMRLATVGYEYALGLTRVTSYYGYDEFSDKERRSFNDFMGRLGLMLSKGRHVAEVAVYYPIQSMWGSMTPTSKTTWDPPDSRRTDKQVPVTRSAGLYLTSHIISYHPDLPDAQRVDAAFGEVSRELLASQHDFDYLDDQAISESSVRAGKLSVSGESFACLVLPEVKVIPLETYRNIADFVSGGGKLVELGDLPVCGMTEAETKEVLLLSEKLSRSANTKRISQLADLLAAIETSIRPDVELDKPCRELFYNHRREGKTDFYYFINLSDRPVERTVGLRSTGRIEWWDPLSGEIIPGTGVRQGKENTLVNLSLPPYQSTIIVFRH